MSNLAVPELRIGMIVVAPGSNTPNITQDKRYIVEFIDGEFIHVRNDKGKITAYKSYLFIEADVYYTILLWLTLIRLFNIDSKNL